MMKLTNFESGELLIEDGEGQSARLTRDQANRLIMMARMHTVAEFIEKLASLISHEGLVQKISHSFEGRESTERWNIKEKFARLGTLAKDYQALHPEKIAEVIQWE
ncbi:MAG: hypothetical protein HY073_02880 [Deltaproteobacteria bacterium]|nr:hypothetical protein [Deltaproteobacteria bacterium]